MLKEDVRIIYSQHIKYSSKELNFNVKKSYPFLYQNESRMITFGKTKETGAESQECLEENRKRRIGVCFNGRQFPGGHNIIEGLVSEGT